MNISIKVGYHSLVLRNVSSNMVDIIMKGIVTDMTYHDDKYISCIYNEPVSCSIISEKDIPKFTRSELERMSEEENGNKDTVES